VTCREFAAATLVAMLASAGGARAQDLEVLDEGKPVEGISVQAILNDGKAEDLGATGADGTLSIDTTRTDFAMGEEVGAWIRICDDGEERLIFVRRGDPLPEEEDCDDELLAYFAWGDGDFLTVDIGDGFVGYEGADGDLSFYGEANFMVKNFYEGDEVSGGDADDKVDGYGGFVGARYRNRVAAGVMLEYAPNADFANTIVGEIDYLAVIGVVRYFLLVAALQPYLQAGYGWARNSADFTDNGTTFDRTHDTGIANFGAGLRYWATRNFGLSTAFEYNTVFEKSADNNWGWKIGIIIGERPVEYY
jgi:hypothetical protein